MRILLVEDEFDEDHELKLFRTLRGVGYSITGEGR
jgi:DNA-binding response OmpR family regulator